MLKSYSHATASSLAAHYIPPVTPFGESKPYCLRNSTGRAPRATAPAEDFSGTRLGVAAVAVRSFALASAYLLAASFSTASLFGQCAPPNQTFINQNVASGTYQAVDFLVADAGNGGETTTISSGANVAFQAGTSITLLPNFHAAPGSSFQASVPNTMVPSISPAALNELGGGGPACATVFIAQGVSWSASSSNSLITFPSGNTGVGSGTLNFLVAPNPSSTGGQTATIIVTSAGGTSTLIVNEAPLASGPPTAALQNALTNGSLSGSATQTLTVTFGGPNGLGYLNYVLLWIVPANSYWGGCSMMYYPQYNQLYFSGLGVSSAYTLGTPGQQAVSDECILDVADSGLTLDNSSTTASVTLNLVLTLQPSAVGTQSVYLYAVDNSGAENNNPSEAVATWTAFSLVTANPPSVSMAGPGAASSQVLHYQINEANGYTFFGGAWVALGQAPPFANSPCYFNFVPPNWISLSQISGDTMTFLGEGVIGASFSWPSGNGIIGGSGGLPGPGTCSINLTQSSVSTGTDGSGVLQNPNSGNPWQPVTTLYLDLWTGLDSTAQSTLPLNVYFSGWDLLGNGPSNANIGTWGGQGTQTQNCLTITVSPPAASFAGASAEPTGQCYTSGTVVQVTAYNAGGYQFVGWSGGLTGTTSTQTVTMNGPVSIIANFTQDVITLQPAPTLTVPVGGTVSAKYEIADGDPTGLSTGCNSDDPYVFGTIDGFTGDGIIFDFQGLQGTNGVDQLPWMICTCAVGYCAVAPPQVAVSGGLPTITLQRQSLLQIAATGSPPNGTFFSGIYNSGGALAGLSMTDNHNGTAALTLSDPNNNGGAPTAGILGEVYVNYVSPRGLSSPVDSFAVPTFGMSCYYIALETDYMTNGQCSNGQPPTTASGITGTYCQAFLTDVMIQGSGFSRGGTAIQFNTNTSAFYFPPNNTPQAATGPLIAGQTVARNYSTIPRATGWTVTVDGVGANLQATDTGALNRITAYRLDLFNGAGQSVCANYPNPIGVAACSPGGASCPSMNIQ
jgi:uncharacterized repeat protein (TIGR02543 family)